MEQAKQYRPVYYVDMNNKKVNTFTEPFKNKKSKTNTMASHSSHVIGLAACRSLFCFV